MKKYSAFVAIIVFFICCAFANDIIDYLSAGPKLKFDRENYHLAWSSHPAAGFYLQEYVREGEEPQHFQKMISLQAFKSDLDIHDAMKVKVVELEKRKKWDPVANYQVYDNAAKPDEGMIDFLISDTISTYEWNLYHYQIQKADDGKKYVVLLFYSYRAELHTNDELKKFFTQLKSQREIMLDKMQAFAIPVVQIKD
jgi:hypothetical protein